MTEPKVYEVSYTVELDGDIKVYANSEEEAKEAVADGDMEVNRVATRNVKGLGYPEVTGVPYSYSPGEVTPDLDVTE